MAYLYYVVHAAQERSDILIRLMNTRARLPLIECRIFLLSVESSPVAVSVSFNTPGFGSHSRVRLAWASRAVVKAPRTVSLGALLIRMIRTPPGGLGIISTTRSLTSH